MYIYCRSAGIVRVVGSRTVTHAERAPRATVPCSTSTQAYVHRSGCRGPLCHPERRGAFCTIRGPLKTYDMLAPNRSDFATSRRSVCWRCLSPVHRATYKLRQRRHLFSFRACNGRSAQLNRFVVEITTNSHVRGATSSPNTCIAIL